MDSRIPVRKMNQEFFHFSILYFVQKHVRGLGVKPVLGPEVTSLFVFSLK